MAVYKSILQLTPPRAPPKKGGWEREREKAIESREASALSAPVQTGASKQFCIAEDDSLRRSAARANNFFVLSRLYRRLHPTGLRYATDGTVGLLFDLHATFKSAQDRTVLRCMIFIE